MVTHMTGPAEEADCTVGANCHDVIYLSVCCRNPVSVGNSLARGIAHKAVPDCLTPQQNIYLFFCSNEFSDGSHNTNTPHLEEQDVYARFLQAYNALLVDRESLLNDCEAMLRFLTDNTSLDAELETLRSEQEVVAGLTRKLVTENASTARRQADYYERYTSLVDRYEEIGEQIAILEQKSMEREARAKEIQSYLRTIISQTGALAQFDPRVWVEVVEQVTVFHDGRVVFRFKDGREITT